MKFRCKICSGEYWRDKDGVWHLTWPAGKSPYGGKYGHKSTLDCDLHKGYPEKELRKRPNVEVIE